MVTIISLNNIPSSLFFFFFYIFYLFYVMETTIMGDEDFFKLTFLSIFLSCLSCFSFSKMVSSPPNKGNILRYLLGASEFSLQSAWLLLKCWFTAAIWGLLSFCSILVEFSDFQISYFLSYWFSIHIL